MMNEYKAIVLFVGVQYGSAVFVLPGVVDQLGVVPYIMILFASITFFTFGGILADHTFEHLLKTTDKSSIVRYPVKVFATEVYGKRFGEIANILQLFTNTAMAIGITILAGTTLQTIIPIQNFKVFDQIRIWIALMYLILLLPSLYGTYNELGIVMYIAFGCILLCELLILATSFIINASPVIELKSIPRQANAENAYKIFVTNFGTLCFANTGLLLMLPNSIVLMKNIEKMEISIICSNTALFVLYLINGIFPFYLLSGYSVDASVLQTLMKISEASGNGTLKVLIIIIQVLSLFHFMAAAILMLNPLHLYIEEKWNVPSAFCWQRVVSRSLVLALVQGICILIPNFSLVLSWVGGVPSFLFGTLFPTALYFKVFTASPWLKWFAATLFVIIIVLSLNINVVDLYIISKIEYGSAVFLLPGVVNQLGSVPFIMVLFTSIAFYTFSAILADHTFEHLLKTTTHKSSIIRHPLKVFATEIYGKRFAGFANILQLFTIISLATGIIILAATTLQTIIPIGNFKFFDQIRIWITLSFLILILPSLYGTYNELGVVMYVAFGSILICELFVIAASIIINASPVIELSSIPPQSGTQTTYETFVTNTGILFLTTAGLFLLLPNVIVLIKDVEMMQSSIVSSSIALFALFLINGMFPFYLLTGYNVESSILQTLTRISKVSDNETLKVLILIIQILSLVHFMASVILFLNPVHLYIEEQWNVPSAFCWQRVVSRIVVLALVHGICILIPNFGPVLSWIGGVPNFLYGTLLPIALYFKVFTASSWLKWFAATLFVVIIVLSLNINFVDLYMIIKNDTF